MKKCYLITLFLFILLVAFSQSDTKKEKIRYLLEITNMGKQSGNKRIDYAISKLKQKYGNFVNENFWNSFRDSINVIGLIDERVMIYDRYYSDYDIDQLIDFYKSPTGKKVIINTPIIFQELMETDQKWEKELFEKAKTEILLK